MNMTTWLLIALIVPLACAYMSLRTNRYFYNVGVSGACAALVLLAGEPLPYLPLACCLVISILGDYFMGHQQHSRSFYIYGIVSFLVAHACLIWFCWDRSTYQPWVLAVGLVLAALCGVYLARRILPSAEGTMMQVAICAYAAVSVLSLAMAVAIQWALLPRILFAVGVLSIVASDTIIAECDFAGEEKFARAIMPTYFICHILITAAALVRLL